MYYSSVSYSRDSYSKELRLDVAQCLVESYGRLKEGHGWSRAENVTSKFYLFPKDGLRSHSYPVLYDGIRESLKAFGVTILIKSESSTWARHAGPLSAVVTGEKWNVK